MRDVYIKKASQDDQHNQTTTTKFNYIKSFLSVLKKKLINKFKIASDKTEIKQNNL